MRRALRVSGIHLVVALVVLAAVGQGVQAAPAVAVGQDANVPATAAPLPSAIRPALTLAVAPPPPPPPAARDAVPPPPPPAPLSPPAGTPAPPPGAAPLPPATVAPAPATLPPAPPPEPEPVRQLPSAAATAVEDLPGLENGEGRDSPGKGRARGKKKGEKSALGTVTIGGRVFALAELQRAPRRDPVGLTTEIRDRNMLDLDVQSARVRLFYDSPIDWISAEVEFDMAGNPDLTDGYVQARGRYLATRFGRFKVPISVIALESPWTLPLVRRGLIHNLLTDWLDVAGRHPGASFSVRGRGGIKPRLTVGAFQGRVLQGVTEGDRDTDRINERGLSSQSLAARATIEVLDTEIGASYEHRVGSYAPGRIKHYWTAGADLVLDKVFTSSGLRVWLDGVAGASWYEHVDKPEDTKDAVFVSGRALVAYRLGGVADEAFYVEPYTLLGFLDPDTDVASDIVFQGVLGVNVGFYHRARLSLEANLDRAQGNFPDQPLDGFLGRSPDRIALMLQGGVSF